MAPSEVSEGRKDDSPLLRAFLEKREALVLFLAARTRSMATAEDLVQDLYLKLSTVDPASVGSPNAFLYRMASHVMIDHVRSAQRTSRREAQWRVDSRTTLGGDAVVEEPAADEVLVAKERVRQLSEAVAELPPQMGRAFRLHKLEGRSQAQTADAMGVSVKMIEQHIQAAMKRLVARLRP